MKAPSHRYSIGQTVRLKSRLGMVPSAAETFRITGTMPVRDYSPQYRIRNDEERHERVMAEDNLEEISEATAEDGAVSGEPETASGGGEPREAARIDDSSF